MAEMLNRLANGHAWVGECRGNATQVADVPAADDPRWIAGLPNLLDTEVLTLSPFYPSGRLGCCVEQKESKPISRHPNHPPFRGCRAWMPLDALAWRPVTTDKEFAKFSLPGIWEEVEPMLFVKTYNGGAGFIEACPDGSVVRFKAKACGTLGGIMQAVQQIDEARASQSDSSAIEQAITGLERSLGSYLAQDV